MKNLLTRIGRSLGRILSVLFNVGIPLKYVLLLLAILGGGVYFMTYHSMLNRVGGKDDYSEAMRYIEIKDTLENEFIDPVDRKALGNAAAAAMVNELGDSWSYYMSEDEYRTYQLSSSNDYSDIGMSIVKDDNVGGFQVISVYPGSPAANAGVGVGMIITAVDGQRLAGYSADQVRTLIRSKLNTVFVLEISNGQNSIEVDCTNANSGAVVSRLEKTGAAYVQIKNFEAGSGQTAVDAIEALLAQDADSLVLDLRNNSGGLSTEVATLLDYLLPGGTLFVEVDKDGNRIETGSDSMSLQLPMAVLINSGTYREAELCAAVLKESGWATLLGEPTVGNTRSQETIVLSDGSAIRLSTHSYLTASGLDISASGGVVPDLICYNSDESATGTTEGTTGGEDGTASISNDEQLMQALRYLS